MNKKSIIISLIVIFVVAAAVVAGIILFGQPKKEDTKTEMPAQTLPIAETPDYKSCEITSPEIIQSTFNLISKNVNAGLRSGLIGPNETKADQCTYNIDGLNGETYSLVVTVYPYSVVAESQKEKDPLDNTWSLMSESKTPSYFRISDSETKSIVIMRVVAGGKNYLFTFSQSKESNSISSSELYVYLLALSNATDFAKNAGAETPSDLPPQPEYN